MNQASSGKPKPSGSRPRAQTALGESKPRDTMLIHGVSDDGQNFAVLRARDDRVEAGIVRRVREGEPIMGELVSLTPRPESPLLCDVEVEYAGPGTGASAVPPASGKTASVASDVAAAATSDNAETAPAPAKLTHGGPAQVATPTYRANWDAIWSKPSKTNAPN